jgi:uncharacterized protein
MNDESIATVRRQNRAVQDDAWIESFLERAAACVIGTAADDRAFLNPNTFIFDRPTRTIWFHTAGQGRTRSLIERSDLVTLCVFEMGRLLPGPVVTDFSVEYASVVVFGRATIIDDPARVRNVFNRQMLKYFPHLHAGRDYKDFTDEEAAKATVYEMAIDRWSAKLHEADRDHEGARRYPHEYFKA